MHHHVEPIRVTVGMHHCLRCHESWLPRVAEPTTCPNPKCRSREWDTLPTRGLPKWKQDAALHCTLCRDGRARLASSGTVRREPEKKRVLPKIHTTTYRATPDGQLVQVDSTRKQKGGMVKIKPKRGRFTIKL